jgi:hypothetical protein
MEKKIDRVIQIIREQMVANAPGAQGGFSSSSNPAGPTAGLDPTMGCKKRYLKGGRGSRKKWLDYLKSSNGTRN